MGLDEFFKGTVDDVEDGAVAAEVGRQPAFDAVLRQDDFLDHFQIGFDVGAAEGVDRLFRIADDKQFAGCQFNFAPVRHALVGLFGQVEQNLILDRIGVLKLVDQDRPVAALEFGAHALVIAHQVARAHQQAVERDMAIAQEALAKRFGVGREQTPE